MADRVEGDVIMKIAGIWLIVAGVALALISFFLSTTVSSEVPYSLYGTALTRTADVVNIGKLQVQTLTFASGGLLFLAGAIFTAAGAILERMDAFVAARDMPTKITPAADLPTGQESAAVVPAEPQAPVAAAEDNEVTMYITIAAAIVIGFFILLIVSTGSSSGINNIAPTNTVEITTENVTTEPPVENAY